MKISGTYLDRLLLIILPLLVVVWLFHSLVKKEDLEANVYIFLIFAGVLWIIDSCVLALKKIKPLYLKDTVYIGDRKIDPKCIIKIIPLTQGARWEYKSIEIQVLADGKIEKFRVLPKPVFFINYIMGHKSSTIKILVDRFPELKDKVSDEVRE